MSQVELDKLDPVERDAAGAFLAQYPPGAGAPLAIVIPAYNEEGTVSEVVAEIPAKVAGLATDVIVVVDGAKDQTAARQRWPPGRSCATFPSTAVREPRSSSATGSPEPAAPR